jgi:hypothetical protein
VFWLSFLSVISFLDAEFAGEEASQPRLLVLHFTFRSHFCIGISRQRPKRRSQTDHTTEPLSPTLNGNFSGISHDEHDLPMAHAASDHASFPTIPAPFASNHAHLNPIQHDLQPIQIATPPMQEEQGASGVSHPTEPLQKNRTKTETSNVASLHESEL